MSFPVCLVFEMVSHWFLLCSRPKDIRDVAHQEDVVHTLENSLKSGHLPHLLMYGPPGTGKTTSALAMVKQLFGPELVKSRVLELNASDERGIGVVRNKIKISLQLRLALQSRDTRVPIQSDHLGRGGFHDK